MTYPGSNNLMKFVIKHTLPERPLTRLDRWRIQFKDLDDNIKIRQCDEMLNYFSIGYTAIVSQRFQDARAKSPEKFDRPWKNKVQYILSGIVTGAEEVFGVTKPMNDVVELYVDGIRQKLPSYTRSIVISSISSMADGINFWGVAPPSGKDIRNARAPSLGDGYLEVMASKGIYKFLQIRVGMSHYRRLAQPQHVKLVMKSDLSLQCDGEAWTESPGTVEFWLFNQMLSVVGTVSETRGIFPAM